MSEQLPDQLYAAERDAFDVWFKKEYHPDKTGPYLKDILWFCWTARAALPSPGATPVLNVERAIIASQQEKIASLSNSLNAINSSLHNSIVTMQAAFIDANQNCPASGMKWITNLLWSSNRLPKEGEPYSNEAQEYYNRNSLQPHKPGTPPAIEKADPEGYRLQPLSEFDAIQAINQQNNELIAALQGMIDIAGDSQGVAGYHLNGAVAEWDEFEEYLTAQDILSKANA